MGIEEELVVRKNYEQIGTWFGYPFEDTQQITTPITPRENMRRYFAGEPVEWVPDLHTDLIDVTPFCMPDIVACSYEGGLDAFGVKWIPDAGNPELPAFVEPGLVTLDDIADWRDLEFPDVESWDWKGMGAEWREFYKDDDRYLRGSIMTGLFERLISLMGFEEAAIAMITEPEEVAEFLDAIADVDIAMAQHLMDDFNCDGIMVLDDWSSQKGPFFSPEVARELLLPPLKKIADYVHSRGGSFTLHSCGNAVDHLPVFIDAGVDAWQAQEDACDMEKVYALYGDDIIVETYFTVPDETTSADLTSYIGNILEPAHAHRMLTEIHDYDPVRCYETRNEFYRQARSMVLEGAAA